MRNQLACLFLLVSLALPLSVAAAPPQAPARAGPSPSTWARDRLERPKPNPAAPDIQVGRSISTQLLSSPVGIEGSGPADQRGFPSARFTFLATPIFEPNVDRAEFIIDYDNASGIAGLLFDNGPDPNASGVPQPELNYALRLSLRLGDTGQITLFRSGATLYEILRPNFGPRGRIFARFDSNASSYNIGIANSSIEPIEGDLSGNGLLGPQRGMRVAIWSRNGRITVSSIQFDQILKD